MFSRKTKVIGAGSYGCVMEPPLPCDKSDGSEKSKYGTKMVTKLLLDKMNGDVEINIATDMLKWKLDDGLVLSDYFIVPHKICKTTLYSKYTYDADILSKCDIRHPTGKETYDQIIMKYGGIDMHQLKNYNKSKPYLFELEEWILMIENLLIAVNIMTTNGLVHLDIKDYNILWDNKNLRVFDFSLLSPIKDVHKDTPIKKIRRSIYNPYPLEMILTKMVDGKRPLDFYTIFYDYNEAIARRNNNNFYRYHSEVEIEDAIKYMLSQTKEDLRKILNRHAHKIDVYGVGMFCIIYHKNINFENANTNVINTYMKLIRNMTHVNCKHRITIKKALSEHKKLKKLIN